MLCDGSSLVLGSICPMAAPTHPPGSQREMNCQGAIFGMVHSCSIEKNWPESQRSDALGKMGITPAVVRAVASTVKCHLKQLSNRNI